MIGDIFFGDAHKLFTRDLEFGVPCRAFDRGMLGLIFGFRCVYFIPQPILNIRFLFAVDVA